MSDILSPLVLGFDMAVPIPLRLVLTSASLCLLNVILFPDVFLQEAKLTKSFFIITILVFVFWGVWEAFIYPKWGSPLRNIPTVTVRILHSNVYHCIDSNNLVWRHSPHRTPNDNV
jgi:hypothetical protein